MRFAVYQGWLLAAALGVLDRLLLSDDTWARMPPFIMGRPDQK